MVFVKVGVYGIIDPTKRKNPVSSKRETIWCYTKSLRDKIWRQTEETVPDRTEPENMGLALRSLLGIIEGIVDSGAMENWDGSEEQIVLIYEEVKDILMDYPELTTAEEVGDQWMEEYAAPNLMGIIKTPVTR